MAKKVRYETLKQGKTLFLVCWPDDNTIEPTMTRVFLTGRPFGVNLIGGYLPFVDVKLLNSYSNEMVDGAVSLRDENIYPFRHPAGTRHKAFFSKRKAKRYLSRAMREFEFVVTCTQHARSV